MLPIDTSAFPLKLWFIHNHVLECNFPHCYSSLYWNQPEYILIQYAITDNLITLTSTIDYFFLPILTILLPKSATLYPCQGIFFISKCNIVTPFCHIVSLSRHFFNLKMQHCYLKMQHCYLNPPHCILVKAFFFNRNWGEFQIHCVQDSFMLSVLHMSDSLLLSLLRHCRWSILFYG